MRDLEDRYAATKDPALATQLVAVSLAEGVLCRFTAFIAVDSQQAFAAGGTPRTHDPGG